ncbi:hypothetical protein K3X13_14685 [Aliiroseovarius crassostreae]|uniref:hypothetical protein n=1 Tax=Aliiroseovarius crassostreae TaxID=154981 RepID=UPI0021F96D53|nr:hypothetical protein [Aliiroseovarius crassostreae]UWP89077.1 hypothetical protein K3J57_14705 [Aliiroseovarius crassostreae]UWP92235.1 hypothetical protein K3X13_14685 [Aliiroseovarius crassostreae]UWP98543.1 hypothetical protein K3X53_14660 [Aliiroseovarius crassostreae]
MTIFRWQLRRRIFLPSARIFSARGRHELLTMLCHSEDAAQAGTPMAVQGEETLISSQGVLDKFPLFLLPINILAEGKKAEGGGVQ